MMEVLKAWDGVIGGIAGAIAGVLVGYTLTWITERRKAKKSVEEAAILCGDRLCSIKDAPNDRVRNDEIYHLGLELDRYRHAIVAKPENRHWAIYNRMKGIILKHDLSDLDQLIIELDALSV